MQSFYAKYSVLETSKIEKGRRNEYKITDIVEVSAHPNKKLRTSNETTSGLNDSELYTLFSSSDSEYDDDNEEDFLDEEEDVLKLIKDDVWDFPLYEDTTTGRKANEQDTALPRSSTTTEDEEMEMSIFDLLSQRNINTKISQPKPQHWCTFQSTFNEDGIDISSFRHLVYDLSLHSILALNAAQGVQEFAKYVKMSFQLAGIVPRKQQWETVYQIISDLFSYSATGAESDKKNYLIQHAVGSGKSYTIACLVYYLHLLKNQDNQSIFSKIVIINDRKALDNQLGDTIVQFLSRIDRCCGTSKTKIAKVNSSSQLQALLRQDSPSDIRIIVTTLQKFTKLLPSSNAANEDAISKILKTERIALIADEAHRSHGKSTTRSLHAFLQGNGQTQQSINLNYFSFTCTPTRKALEMFGVLSNGEYQPFYTYSIEQSLKDGLIMNVLENYSCLHFDVTVEVSNDILSGAALKDAASPDGSEAAKKRTYKRGSALVRTLIKEARGAKELVKSKAEYIVKHFKTILETETNEHFSPKAMVVASSRRHVLLYFRYLRQIIATLPVEERFEVVAAFTIFKYKGKMLSESDVNQHYAAPGALVKAFKDANSQVKIIVCAEKFQTGFDEPKLHTMYVDKTLKSSNAVQTLGRLSRIANVGKKGTCVVDFINSKHDIEAAFAKYWSMTTAKTGLRPVSSLEEELTSLATRLCEIRFFTEQDITKAAHYILLSDEIYDSDEFDCILTEEDLKDNKKHLKGEKKGKLERDLKRYNQLCDRLQHDCPSLPYQFVARVLEKLLLERINLNRHWFDNFAKELRVMIGKMQQIEDHNTIFGDDNLSLLAKPLAIWSQQLMVVIDRYDEMSITEIVDAANQQFKKRLEEALENEQSRKSSQTHSPQRIPSGEELSEDTLDFAKEVWKVDINSKVVMERLASSTLKRSLGYTRHENVSGGCTNARELDILITETASTVIERGEEYESGIKQHTRSDPKFSFLYPSDPNHAYYLQKIAQLRQATSSTSTTPTLSRESSLTLSDLTLRSSGDNVSGDVTPSPEATVPTTTTTTTATAKTQASIPTSPSKAPAPTSVPTQRARPTFKPILASRVPQNVN